LQQPLLLLLLLLSLLLLCLLPVLWHQVEVVRPHFLAPVAAAVAAHPLFQLHNWEPFRPITEVVALLKQLLEVRHAWVTLWAQGHGCCGCCCACCMACLVPGYNIIQSA
jgi:hypothetical protein